MAVPNPRALSGTWLSILPASPSSQAVSFPSRLPLSASSVRTLSSSSGRMPWGAWEASSRSRVCTRARPERAVSSRSGRTPARAFSCRRAKAQSVSRRSARKQKAMLTPMAVLTIRGIRALRFRNRTIGSAASASAVPSRKGDTSGSRNFPVSQTAAKTASVENTVWRGKPIGECSFRGR